MNADKIEVEGFEALRLEDEDIKLEVIPSIGGKVVSLVYKETGYDFMWRNPYVKLKTPKYGDPYPDYDVSGVDECFPTIGECHYPEYPWRGVIAPDHGEVWALPWDYEITEKGVRMWVYGVRFPYMFERTLQLEGGGKIMMDYKVENLSPLEFKYNWAIHPIFKSEPKLKILLPDGVKVRTDWGVGFRLGNFFTVHDWPITKDKDGREVDLSVVEGPDLGAGDKIFTEKLDEDEGWCALHYTDEHFVGFGFSPSEIPYIGVWTNQGGYPLEGKAHFNVALEPCLGYPDRIDIAVIRGEHATLGPKAQANWRMMLVVGKAEKIRGITPDGVVR